jgi:hypothetical protein
MKARPFWAEHIKAIIKRQKIKKQDLLRTDVAKGLDLAAA